MKKTLIALTLLAMLGQSAFAGSSFEDVDGDNAFVASIQYLKDNGIIDGYSDGTYRPLNKINRAEMLKILIEGKMIDVSEYADDKCFDDVPSNEWYTQYVCYAKELGIVQGYSGNLFKPTQSVSFVEAMKMTLETYGYFYDENTIWYKDIVEQASIEQFIPMNIVGFDQQIDRSQMADIIARVLNREDDTLESFLGEGWGKLRTYEDIEAAGKYCSDWLAICFSLPEGGNVVDLYPEYSHLNVGLFTNTEELEMGDAGMQYAKISLNEDFADIQAVKAEIADGQFYEYELDGSAENIVIGDFEFYTFGAKGLGSSVYDYYFLEKNGKLYEFKDGEEEIMRALLESLEF